MRAEGSASSNAVTAAAGSSARHLGRERAPPAGLPRTHCQYAGSHKENLHRVVEPGRRSGHHQRRLARARPGRCARTNGAGGPASGGPGSRHHGRGRSRQVFLAERDHPRIRALQDLNRRTGRSSTARSRVISFSQPAWSASVKLSRTRRRRLNGRSHFCRSTARSRFRPSSTLANATSCSPNRAHSSARKAGLRAPAKYLKSAQGWPAGLGQDDLHRVRPAA